MFTSILKGRQQRISEKDEFKRKTDGFQAFIHALWQADNILVDEFDFMLDGIKF